MDPAEFDIEQVSAADRTGQQQTVETFVEFARQSSLSGGIPRLRSASYQYSPVLARHLARERPLVLSCEPRPTHVVEPPLSPSAISPDSEEVECEEAVFGRASGRQRSYSDSESLPQTPDPVAFQRTLEHIKEMSGLQEHGSEQRAFLVAKKLKAIAEDYNRNNSDDHPRCSLWSIIAIALGSPHRAIVNEFAKCIKRLHYEDFSWEFVVRFFMVGLRLLESLSSRSGFQEQQSALLGIFLDFLTDKVATWIEDQGGWESFSAEIRVSQALRRASFPSGPGSPSSSSRFPHQLQRIPSERESGTDSPSAGATTTSTPPCSRRPLVCHLPDSAVSLATGRGRSRPVSVPTRPTSLSLSQNTSHSYPEPSSSTTSTKSHLLSAGLAFAFGVALGSFLTQLK